MRTQVAIQNLKCGGCQSTIVKKLNSLEGIQGLSVNLDDCTVSFTYETMDGIETVEKELTKLGYPLQGDVNHLGNKAKSYLSCAIGRFSK